MKTEFRKLAERIAEDMNKDHWDLYRDPAYKKSLRYARRFFTMPMDEYFKDMGELPKHRNNIRLLILLFAEQHYLTYRK